jgi:hypothetical protein
VPFGTAGHNSARAAPWGHLPLSKVNREAHPLVEKKPPEGGFQGGSMGGFTKEQAPIQTAVGLRDS